MPEVRKEIGRIMPRDKNKDNKRRARDHTLERQNRKKKLPKELVEVIGFIPEGPSSLKVALYYTKMGRDKGVVPTGLMKINPTMFPNESVCRRVALLLRNNGLIAQCDNGRYIITTRGVFATNLLSMREPSREQVTDSQGGV